MIRVRFTSKWLFISTVCILWFTGAVGSVRLCCIAMYRVAGYSMEPALGPEDLLVAGRLPFQDIAPGRGDVVVYDIGVRPLMVKRVVAIQGDTLVVRNGHLYVNSRRMSCSEAIGANQSEPPDAWHYSFLVNPARGYKATIHSWGPIVVPPDAYFVLGDNPRESGDSREHGFIRRREIVGRAFGVIDASELRGTRFLGLRSCGV